MLILGPTLRLGLISALAFSSDVGSGMFAAGSYAGKGSVCFYTEDTGETAVGELELGSAVGRGVTQVCDGDICLVFFILDYFGD
jgi:hypothetical protein